MTNLKLVSWNVNGIRAIIKKDFVKDVREMAPDILCLQETKATVDDTQKAFYNFEEYKVYANESKARKGYSGTAIVTKMEPISVKYDMGIPEHDQEGRVIVAEFENFHVVVVYTPNSGEGLKRLDYREQWDQAFFNYCQELNEKKPVILNGDLNVAHTEMDIARAKPNFNKSAGYTQKEIDGLERFLGNGYIDTFRHFYPEEIKYSWWNYKFRARERNVGWRIDYFLLSDRLKEYAKSAAIHNQYYGSDHCPIELSLELPD